MRGEKIALMGRNGAGKTTLLKCAARRIADRPASNEQGRLRRRFAAKSSGDTRSPVGYFAQDHKGSIQPRA